MRYVDIEDALAGVMRIAPSRLATFRAQLRHLRNIGVPSVPKPGSGRAIDYTREHALEMLLALELQKIGQTAQRAARVAGSIVRTTPYGQWNGEDCYVYCQTDRREYTVATGLDQMMTVIKSGPPAFAVINVSACVRKLEEAFSEINTRR